MERKMIVSPYLDAATSYREALPEVIARIVNGCGPGNWKVDLVPDNLLGLDISECCDIHDWDYTVGETEADKQAGDHRLLHNVIARINAAVGPFDKVLKPFRYIGAYDYYLAVKEGGHSAFWAGKNPETHMAGDQSV
jgi:hypothetical protein